MLKKTDTCLYCGAPVKVKDGAAFAYCESCGRVMEVTKFTEEERRLVQAVDELRQSSERAQQDFLRAVERAEKAQSEAEKRAVQAAESVAKALSEELYQVNHRLEASEARMLRNMYVQAESAQRVGRFEDAERWYRQILIHDESEAEVHWRLVLCRYGVEYVREQASGRFLPTICHMVVDSVTADADYRRALSCARSDEIRAHYEREAMAIEQILDRYRQIRATEKPYDVFISVKQGDSSGNPTKDSQIAQDLYYMIRDKLKLRVFNSRISLAQHAGTEFEPYIMAALMSAKVMLVVGTGSAHMNSPWVRNEWRRFRWLKDNENTRRRLIALISGMSVKEIPIEMGDHQAISMDNVNAMESLRRSLQEAFGTKNAGAGNADGQAAKMLELASISLEFGEFGKVEEYCEKALYMEPKNSRAYALKLCAEFGVKSVDELGRSDSPIDDCINFKKAVHFGDETEKARLLAVADDIRARLENQKLEKIYAAAVSELSALTKQDPIDAAEAATLSARAAKVEEKFRSVGDYGDADELLGYVHKLQTVFGEKYRTLIAAEKAAEEAERQQRANRQAEERERRAKREQEKQRRFQDAVRTEIRELELQCAAVKGQADALNLSSRVRKLEQQSGNFAGYWDGPNLQATCDSILVKCEQVLSEKTEAPVGTLGQALQQTLCRAENPDKLVRELEEYKLDSMASVEAYQNILGSASRLFSAIEDSKERKRAMDWHDVQMKRCMEARLRFEKKAARPKQNISRKLIVPSIVVLLWTVGGFAGMMWGYTELPVVRVLEILCYVLAVPMLIEMGMKFRRLGTKLEEADSVRSVWMQSPWPKLALLMACMVLVMALVPMVVNVNEAFSADPVRNYRSYLTAVSFACYSAMTFVERLAQGRKSCLIPLVTLAFFGWNMTIYL